MRVSCADKVGVWIGFSVSIVVVCVFESTLMIYIYFLSSHAHAVCPFYLYKPIPRHTFVASSFHFFSCPLTKFEIIEPNVCFFCSKRRHHKDMPCLAPFLRHSYHSLFPPKRVSSQGHACLFSPESSDDINDACLPSEKIRHIQTTSLFSVHPSNP